MTQTNATAPDELTGILLAAGRGTRFDPSGARNKLLAALPGGGCVANEAARRLRSVVPRVLAVVRPDEHALAQTLESAGCIVVRTDRAARGMGASLAAAVQASRGASGWLVALADMPSIAPATIAAVARALTNGATLAAPFHQGQRGHPVGLGRIHLDALLALDGDTGPRALFGRSAFARVDVTDPGILFDIDAPSDIFRVPLCM